MRPALFDIPMDTYCDLISLPVLSEVVSCDLPKVVGSQVGGASGSQELLRNEASLVGSLSKDVSGR